MDQLLPDLATGSLDTARDMLRALSASTPQTLLFEGGTESQRLQLGQYWAMLVNCPSALSTSGKKRPCLACTVCKQIAAYEYADLLVYDGRISNAQDEENPGHIRSLRMDNIRDLKISIGASPHGNGKRVVLLQGMSPTREEAMNSLLKVLEEPSPSTLFVLLTSQREEILPTLVSRSIVLTLPWTNSQLSPAKDVHLLDDFALFLQNGSSFMDKIIQKGQLDQQSASALLLECQKSLVRQMGGGKCESLLDKSFKSIAENSESADLVHVWLNEAHQMLKATVNPQRVIEAIAYRLYELVQSRH